MVHAKRVNGVAERGRLLVGRGGQAGVAVAGATVAQGLQQLGLGLVVMFEIDGGFVELGGAIECQLGERFARGVARVALGPFEIVRRQPVAR